jgi:hypothetical protein
MARLMRMDCVMPRVKPKHSAILAMAKVNSMVIAISKGMEMMKPKDFLMLMVKRKDLPIQVLRPRQ